MFTPRPDAGAGRRRRRPHGARRSARTSGIPTSAEAMAESGAEILLVPNGSPYFRGKFDVRLNMVGGARGRDRAAAGLPQHGGRPGRPGVRRRLLRAEPRRRAGGAAAGVRGGIAPRRFRRERRRLARAARARWRAIPDAWEQDYRHGRGPARLPAQDRVRQGAAGAVGRHRLGARRGHRRRCDRAGERALRDAAVGLYLASLARRCGTAMARALGCRLDTVPISGARGGGGRGAGAPVRGARARHRRGERAVPAARAAADGAVEQVRRDAADHRQQVRGRGRLCHDLRRHGGRLQSGEGPLQDPRLRDLPLAQRATTATG